MSSHDSVPTYDFDPEGVYPKDKMYVGEAFSSDMFAGAATGFLNDYEDDAPFFLYVAFTAPHDPRTPPEGYTYDPDSVPLPPNFVTEHPFDNGMLSGRDEDLAPAPPYRIRSAPAHRRLLRHGHPHGRMHRPHSRCARKVRPRR